MEGVLLRGGHHEALAGASVSRAWLEFVDCTFRGSTGHVRTLDARVDFRRCRFEATTGVELPELNYVWPGAVTAEGSTVTFTDCTAHGIRHPTRPALLTCSDSDVAFDGGSFTDLAVEQDVLRNGHPVR
ncbi:MAG: hypothetical protein HC807_07065, partial [Gammaproteobacteria bacterium]|nr:hypothetical protein [Gammaproteobacteria bacterium]